MPGTLFNQGLLIKPALGLSQLSIDVDKDWSGFGSNPPGVNPVVNGTFEDSLAGNWTSNTAGSVVTRSTDHVQTGYLHSLKVVNTDGIVYGGAYQQLSGLGNKTVTAGCWIWCSTPGIACITTWGGAYSAYHPGDSQWRFVTVTNVINNANQYAYCIVANRGTAYFDGFVLATGSSLSPPLGMSNLARLVAQINFLGNGHFALGNPPSGWNLYTSGGGSYSQATSPVYAGAYSLAITSTGNVNHVYQFAPNPGRYAGKYITFLAWVWASVASAAYLGMDDGTTGAQSPRYPGDSQWHLLTASFTAGASPSRINTECDFDGVAGTAYFNSAQALVTDVPIAGDLIYHDGIRLLGLRAGSIGANLISNDVGNLLDWGYPP